MDKVKRFLGKPAQGSSTPNFRRTHVNGQPIDDDADDEPVALPPPRPAWSKNPPRILIIGAGSRGVSNAFAIMHSSNAIVAAVAEPVESKRKQFGKRFIWGGESPRDGEEFEHWKDFVRWEVERRERGDTDGSSKGGIDGVVICTLDKMHLDVIADIAPLNLHILSEKPLATSLDDCLKIYRLLRPKKPEKEQPSALFAIGHIMRYSPYNMLLRKLLLEDEVVGDVVSVDHMESVGWWHFAHSYVRGNWRKESVTAPTLLTKSCHDIDFLMWLLCSPSRNTKQKKAHIPSTVTATGSVVHFKKSRKPHRAEKATNCLSCPIESECQYSSRKIYHDKGILQGLGGWPVNVVLPDIEDYFDNDGLKGAENKLMEVLAEDYDKTTMPEEEIDKRQWYGRCVYESDNDVCDDQTVTISWEEESASSGGSDMSTLGRGAKTATFHMTAFSEPICKHRTHIYGTKGEIEADSTARTITVRDFATGERKVHKPHLSGGAHSGGDFGLMMQFSLAVDAVKNHGMDVEEAQRVHVGCTVEEIIRSHAMVFAAEEARKGKKVVHWDEWWRERTASIDGFES